MVATLKINMEQKKSEKDSTGVNMETETAPDSDQIPDEENETTFGLSDAFVRQTFIMKVYGTLTIQMLVTLVLSRVILLVITEEDAGNLHTIFAWVIFSSPIVLIPMTFSLKSLKRRAPENVVLLLGFSLIEAIILRAAILDTKLEAIFLACGLIVMMTMTITYFARQIRVEFTIERGMFLVVAMMVVLYSVCGRFFGHLLQQEEITGASFFAGCFCLALLYDTRRLLRIQGNDELTPDDYIYTAFKIHLDVFNILFLYSVVVLFYLMLGAAVILGYIEKAFGARVWPRGSLLGDEGSFYSGEHSWDASVFQTFNGTDWMGL